MTQTLENKGFEAPAQYTAQYFAIKFEKASKCNNHGRFQPCTVLLHSIAQYRADLRISIHLLCKVLYKYPAQLCMLSNRVVGKNAVCKTTEDLVSCIRKSDAGDQHIWERYMGDCDGHSCERVAHFVLDRYFEGGAQQAFRQNHACKAGSTCHES